MENTVDIDSLDFTPTHVEEPVIQNNVSDVAIDLSDYNTALSDVYKMYTETDSDSLIYDSRESKIYDLPKEDQLEVLLQLMKNKVPVAQESPQLDDQEINFLNQLREAGISVDEYLDSLNTYTPSQTSDISKMSNEQVVEYDIRKTLADAGKEATDEDIIDQIEALRSTKNFAKIADSIKTKLLREEESEVAYQNQLESDGMDRQYQEMSTKIIDKSISLGNISGFDLDNDDRNTTIQSLIELDENGLTWFDNEVLAKPDNLVRASWLIRNENNINKYISELESKLSGFESGIQNKINEAYKQGQQDIIKNKFPANLVSSSFSAPQKTSESPMFNAGGLNPSVSFDPKKIRNIDEL